MSPHTDAHMWIEKDADEECLRTWIRNCPAMKLVSTLDGKIVWANAAFCSWSQYTLSELLRKKWIDISVDDMNLQSDLEEARRLDSSTPIYKAKRQSIPKGSDPEWGMLTVMRYPIAGEVKFYLCTWEPIHQATSLAFEMAMKNGEKTERRIGEMAEILKAITSQTEEDRYVLSTINMIRKHPRMAVSVLAVGLGLFGLNNILEVLQRTGIIEIPIRIEPVDKEVGAVPVDHSTDIVRHY